MKARRLLIFGLAVGLLALALAPVFVEAATPRPVALYDELELDMSDGSMETSEFGMPEPELKQVTQGKGKWINGDRQGKVDPYTLHGPKARCSIMIVEQDGEPVEYHVRKVTPLENGRNRYTVKKL